MRLFKQLNSTSEDAESAPPPRRKPTIEEGKSPQVPVQENPKEITPPVTKSPDLFLKELKQKLEDKKPAVDDVPQTGWKHR